MINIIHTLLIFVGCWLAVYGVTHWPTKPDATRLLEDDELDGQITLHLYHSLEPSDVLPVYSKRGTITVNSARNEAIYIEESPLSITEVEKLKKLSTTDDLYRVMLTYKPDEPESNSIFSFTKACAIYESGPTDIITVTLDQSNIPVGVSVSALPPYCYGNSNPKLDTFNTSVNIVPLVNGPLPDTLTYIQRLEQEKAEKARGEQGDNRSFFAKYWMYIVPFVILLVISGATGPEAQNAGR